MMTEPAQDLPVSIARFTGLFAVDVAEQMDVEWERVLRWLETKPTARWNEQCAGWSPVHYDPPRRAKENIKQVYGLVLDYDKSATWDAVCALWSGFYGLVYTTKSHSIGAHRLRVVLPLSRPVTADEYGRLWVWADRQSKQAELQADGQAKDASRYWYVPTATVDGDWRTLRLEGNPLDVDATLPLVDVPQLRVVRMPAIVTTDTKVMRARRYLEKIPGAVSGDKGHTQTFNAVSHVMIGFDLDPDTTYSLIASDYNPRCDPPWTEKQLLHKIRQVAEKSVRVRGYLLESDRQPIYSTQAAADRAPELPSEHDVDWRADVCLKKSGEFRRAYQNVLRLVRHHPDYRGKWSLNAMTGETYFGGVPMHETFIHDIRAHGDKVFGYTPSTQDVEAAIATSVKDRQFHPIQQYLRSVDWDGVERLSSMARDYLGSESALHADLVRKWMISAVARALNPGCKVDTALMLHGEQGYFKSTFFTILGGPWHADSPIDIANKDSYQQIHAAWIYEFAELENVVTGRAESRLKAWLTSTHDMFRAPYAKAVERKPRSCVICGTTNRKNFLTDDTGSRRFWIVSVSREIPRGLLAEMRDQLWAEAVVSYEAGDTWWLDRDAERQREAANADYQDEDPWREPIEAFLRPAITETTVAEVLGEALKLDFSRQDHFAQRRVGRVLSQMGWQKIRETSPPRRWKYLRPGHQTEID